ncbi:PorP/SprF family type IX secretion system membrane protein [Parapedobacter sp.]
MTLKTVFNMKLGVYPIIALCALLVGAQGKSLAQQTPSFGAYNYDPFIINPAYAGMAPGSVINLSHQRYTRNIEGTPQSSSVSFHTPLSADKMGLGLSVMDDRIGVTSATSTTLAYSYKLFFDHRPNRPYWQVYDQNVLSFGMTVGIKQLYENLVELGIADDPAFAENLAETIPVIGAGLLYNRVGFYLGISMPNLLGDRVWSRDDIHLSSPMYGYFGYRFFTDIYNENMVTPSVLVKYERGAPAQIDVNVSASFKSRFEVGAGFRTSSSMNFLAGFYPMEQLRVIYHYSIGLKSPVLGNNHGLVVSYAFGYD